MYINLHSYRFLYRAMVMAHIVLELLVPLEGMAVGLLVVSSS